MSNLKTGRIEAYISVDVLKSNVLKSDVLKPDRSKPNILKPDVLKPDVLKPDVLKPDVLWVYHQNSSEIYSEKKLYEKNCSLKKLLIFVV